MIKKSSYILDFNLMNYFSKFKKKESSVLEMSDLKCIKINDSYNFLFVVIV